MKFIADFHIHSRFSIATSKNLVPEQLELWARLKGIDVVGTGDCIHPGWMNELREKLAPAENGLYVLKNEFRLDESKAMDGALYPPNIYFILSGEISNIYKKNGRVRKVHNLCVFPDFESASYVQTKLGRMGNITSDGRPVLGLDSRTLLEITLESSDFAFLVPAHIWTPWFSVLGSKSGFDGIEECYGELTDHIFALETGLSSDPDMNRLCSFLDRYRLISNSDAHSPEKLGREANRFEAELTYRAIYNSLKTGTGFNGTIEFFPEEGKYHYDGHRKCGIRCNPQESIEKNNICPVCGKPLTLGVMHRVAELSDRSAPLTGPADAFRSTTSLSSLIAQALGQKNENSVSVKKLYQKIIDNIGPELFVLLDAETILIKESAGELIAEGISRLRNGKVILSEGYDGEFGKIRVFRDGELAAFEGERLWNCNETQINKIESSIRFDVGSFKSIKESSNARGSPEEKIIKLKSYGATEDQKSAILHAGRGLVIAGPGSGKTWVLVSKIMYLIEKGYAPESLLAITFSNRAAREIQERMPGSKANIVTFHSLGLSILRENYSAAGLRNGFRVITDNEKNQLISEMFPDSTFTSISKEISLLKQNNVSSDKETAVGFFKKMISDNTVDYDDLILLPLKILSNDSGIRERYIEKFRAILVDEIQDMNRAQIELLALIHDPDYNDLTLIGDPDQSIYSFRGAGIDCIKDFRRKYPNIRVIRLKKSFRCPDVLLRCGEAVLNSPVHLEGIESESKLHIQANDTDRAEADWIAAEIESIVGGVRSLSIASGISDGTLASGEIGFADIAVLCRSSFMFALIIEAFANHGIPTQVVGGESMWRVEPAVKIIRAMAEIISAGTSSLYSDEICAGAAEMFAKGDTAADILKFMLALEGVGDKESAGLLSFAAAFGDDAESFVNEASMASGHDDFDRRAEAVALMTIHAAKGLEFDTVFIPGFENGIIPFTLFVKTSAELDEEKRVFYVGITRAKRQCYLSHAGLRMYRGRSLEMPISPYLKLFNDKLIESAKRQKKIMKENEKTPSIF
jgi:uncharacterized protein (TIGR00375 family)